VAAIGADDWRVSRFGIEALNLGRHVEETFRAEKTVAWPADPLVRRKNLCSGECEARVTKLKLRLPPSGLRPQATAMASSRVDLPEPFSPMRKVTAGAKSMVSRCRTAASEKG
jgi:hypothetical protein